LDKLKHEAVVGTLELDKLRRQADAEAFDWDNSIHAVELDDFAADAEIEQDCIAGEQYERELEGPDLVDIVVEAGQHEQ
jgi:hypothetical protein